MCNRSACNKMYFGKLPPPCSKFSDVTMIPSFRAQEVITRTLKWILKSTKGQKLVQFRKSQTWWHVWQMVDGWGTVYYHSSCAWKPLDSDQRCQPVASTATQGTRLIGLLMWGCNGRSHACVNVLQMHCKCISGCSDEYSLSHDMLYKWHKSLVVIYIHTRSHDLVSFFHCLCLSSLLSSWQSLVSHSWSRSHEQANVRSFISWWDWRLQYAFITSLLMLIISLSPIPPRSLMSSQIARSLSNGVIV